MSVFRRLLNPEQRRRIDAESSETVRLFSLPDRFLARALLNISRDVRQMRNGDPSDRAVWSEETAMVLFDLVPEIAHRLGETSFSSVERLNTDLKAGSIAELRHYAVWVLNHGSINRLPYDPLTKSYRADHPDRHCLGVDLLTHDAANGNVLAIAIDRLCPPEPDTPRGADTLADYMREVSRIRGIGAQGTWHPGFQDFERNRPSPQEPEDDRGLDLSP